MKERPILFSGPMVRAILAGEKTQTRRVVKLPGVMPRTSFLITSPAEEMLRFDDGSFHYLSTAALSGPYPCPYGQPGDRLWVRETWAHYQTVDHARRSDGRSFSEVSDGLAGYRADGFESIEEFRDHIRLMGGLAREAVEINGDRWRPSIHMPRWACRLVLEINDVRVERLQSISEADAMAEGAERDTEPCDHVRRSCAEVGCLGPTHRAGFADLWASINGQASWDANPWVWVLSFRRIGA